MTKTDAWSDAIYTANSTKCGEPNCDELAGGRW